MALTRRDATQWSSPQDLTAVLRFLYLARSRPSPASRASYIVSVRVESRQFCPALPQALSCGVNPSYATPSGLDPLYGDLCAQGSETLGFKSESLRDSNTPLGVKPLMEGINRY